MTIAATFDIDCTTSQYDEVMLDLEAAGVGRPDGRRLHVACAGGRGVVVVDVWDSAEQLDAFASSLVPTLDKHGIEAPAPQVSVVHNLLS